ncbi:MAG: ATP-grasp domain-containing protein [Actinomycetota bacterium]|nr:ATP-grasp domain-containing protein [Actinomycetota bacterium]
MNSIRRVLVANRGEIALRVIRAAKDLGISTVAVFAGPDADAPFVRMADSALDMDGDTPATTYLDAAKLISAASTSGADAIHPGYGFLSESAEFARAVGEAGLTWIGPPESAIRMIGDKVRARAVAKRVGAPLAPGSDGPIASVSELAEFIAEHGLPVVIKAAFGGGGRGMRVVTSATELERQFEAAQREALAAFGRGECFVERYLVNPRHVEAQVVADTFGTVIVAGIRDCSLQRRHQKVVEEAPAPFLAEEQRAAIVASAKRICAEAGYVGAGTVEYLVVGDGGISFLEVNTRLQVEHPVTEETAGMDIVVEQFRVAMGEPLSLSEDPLPRGHALEFRINAEDPANGFLPAPGRITRLVLPAGPGVRVDAGVSPGGVVDARFDSLLAKLIVTGRDRDETIRRARRALGEFEIEGVPTLVPLHRAILEEPDFVASKGADFKVHTGWIEQQLVPRLELEPASEPSAVAYVRIGGQPMAVRLPAGVDPSSLARKRGSGTAARPDHPDVAVVAPMQGTVVKVAVSEGQEVALGEQLFSIEAMKMENAVLAHRPGVVKLLSVAVGQSVRRGLVLCEIGDPPGGGEHAY